MIRRLLAELAERGTLDRRELARRLDVPTAMLDQMIERLAAQGYVERVAQAGSAPAPACRTCPVAGGCRVETCAAVTAWRLTDAGRRAAGAPELDPDRPARL